MPLLHKWFAIRTGDGDGSEGNPFSGSTSLLFDEHMREIADIPATDPPTDFHIHLGAGTFATVGLRHFATTAGGHVPGINKAGDKGWFVRSNWTITGAGEAATTIKLEQWSTFDGSAVSSVDWAVAGCGADQLASNVLIEHLAVDGNWDSSRPANAALYGMALVSGG